MTPRDIPSNSYGLSPRESDVLDRWDAGQSRLAIAAATGLDQRYVGKIITMYSHSGADDVREAAKIRAASAALAAACIATGRCFR